MAGSINLQSYFTCIITSFYVLYSELARAVRYIGVPALADDILNISTWRVSWNVLLAVARPYTLRDSTDGTPIKDVASSMQQILKPRGSRPSSLSRQSSGDLKSKRLSVAFEPLESDNEKEQMRPKTAIRSQDLPNSSQFAPVVSSSTEWSSQIRQPRDLKLTKSMDQESWHDADRSQSYYSDDNNIGQGVNSTSILHPRDDLSRSPDVSRLSQLDNGRRKGEQSVESERTQTRTEAQKRWVGRSIEVEGGRNDSNSDEFRHAEDEAYDTSKWSPPQSMPKKDNRLELSPGGSPAPRRKSITEQSEGLRQRRQDTQPLIERPKTGSMSPLLFPKPTTTSLSPSKLNSRELKSNMTGSSDSSLASGPHPMASSWETAVSPRSEGDQSGDGKGLTPAKPPRPQSLQSHLPPAFATEKPMRPSMSMTPAMSMNKSLYGDRSQMKRSISWSAAVSSEFTKPPRTKSASYILSSSFNSSSWDSEAQEGYGDGLAGSQDLERHVVLSPLSEYALRTGVIIEGWLEKKSAVTGFWQKVSTDQIILRATASHP